MPTLLKRPGSPYWYVRVQRNGREFWRSTREAGRARAEARALKLLTEIQDQAYGVAMPPRDLWTSDWWSQYWDARTGAVAASAATKRAYVERLLGPYRLRQLRPSHFAAYVAARRADGAAPATIALEGRLLKQVLGAAVEEGLLERNVAKAKTIQWPKAGTRSRVLSPEEEAALLAELGPPWPEALVVALGTGLRGAELAGLTAAQVLWEVPAIRLTGKGGKRREVPVFPAAQAALQRAAAGRPTGRLWPVSESPTQQVTTFNHALRRAWRRAGGVGPSPTTHVFRHTFATRFLQRGGDIYILSKILGHASVAITERVYAHLLAGEITARALAVQMP